MINLKCLNFRGATGSWIIEAPQHAQAGGSAVWVTTNGGAVPEGAFVGGDDNGEALFVGRAQHEGALLPGKNSFESCKTLISNLKFC